MNMQTKIIDIANKNKGYVTTEELEVNDINRYYLDFLIKEGTLNRVSKGYYTLKKWICR
ncbi:MAG: type IV toxin-antitoxin system AbiEi family antitoxin domain-containing protein [Bacilli bacterium]|nr:type IV toxin-antitoxin system AbiEi family antitoxin domain-containing protein [Bacilli bacterium]